MAEAILVDGVADGKMDALVGTNWLVGPVRIRQERSLSEGDQCRFKLENTFGTRTGEALLARGIECTANWEERPPVYDAPPPPDFLNLSQPLESENGTSFREAFPEWYAQQTRGSDHACCTTTAGCYANVAEQQRAIARDRGRGEWSLWKAGKQSREHACSVNSASGFLHHNPPHSYRSTIKDSPMVRENIWGMANEFGDGGFHIDLPGNSSTFKRQLTALQELNFVDQFTRAVTFQFLLCESAVAATVATAAVVTAVGRRWCRQRQHLHQPAGRPRREAQGGPERGRSLRALRGRGRRHVRVQQRSARAVTVADFDGRPLLRTAPSSSRPAGSSPSTTA